jgi:dihydroorotate dehydrogenase electron transfer subunit
MLDAVVEIHENLRLTGGHFLLTVYSPSQAGACRPGQFGMLRLLNRSDILLRRPMSVYDVISTGKRSKSPTLVRFLYKEVGRGTRAMAQLKPGDAIGLLGPLGHGFFLEEYEAELRRVDQVVHVAGGIGIAALLLSARELHRRKIPQTLFFGGRGAADLVCWRDFRPYVTDTVLATEDGSQGHAGFVTLPVADYLMNHRGRRILLLVCGPGPMMGACVSLAREYGHPCLVSMENRMGCGMGVCLGCSIAVRGEGHGAYERVCTEGPVFWANYVRWEKEVIPQL